MDAPKRIHFCERAKGKPFRKRRQPLARDVSLKTGVLSETVGKKKGEAEAISLSFASF
ncbi:hypothetical protein [uncultured Pseudoteredinibacter sp.]|uniref:hypothetical protein n=1 Tax=uncultured Pseudoteredinibacter sp. TaxID=1641701 RepID=UPI00262D7ED4|nr:hypothetical protein [uncultured Pseudoteredinibacter sp.]